MNYYYLISGFLIIGFVLCWLINRAWKKIDAESYYRQGYDYVIKSEYDKAISELTKVIHFNSKHARAYINRGSMWVGKGDYDKAITDYTEGIRIDPNNSYAYFNRGVTFFNIDEYDKAIADLTEVIRIDSNDKDAYNYRGCSYRAKNEHDKAIIDFTESIRLDPNDIFAYNCRACSFRGTGDYDNAVSDYTEAIRIDPDEMFAYNNRAWLYATCPVGKYRNSKQSIEDATKACELSSWNISECIGTLAASYAESDDFENAIKWIKKAISMDDNLKDTRQEMLSLFEQNKPYREKLVN